MIRRPPRSTLFPSTPLSRSAAGDLRLEPVPLRARRQDEAVVRIAYGGICGSDLHYWLHGAAGESVDRKSTRLNSSHANISYAVFCLKKKKRTTYYLHFHRFI